MVCEYISLFVHNLQTNLSHGTSSNTTQKYLSVVSLLGLAQLHSLQRL